MKTINKSDVSRRLENSTVMAQISVVVSIILGSVSLYEKDLRYMSVAILIFSVCCLGHLAYWSWHMYKRDRGEFWFQDIFSLILAILFSLLSVGLFVYGIAVFLHHYDIDALINLYIESFNHFKN
jgi:hypothetical protein